jgi:hypothetical protein
VTQPQANSCARTRPAVRSRTPASW